MKRAQKDGIEFTERLGGMVSREAIKQAPSGHQSEKREPTVTARSPGPATVEAEMRSIITNDDDEIDDELDVERGESLSEPPSISSLGQILPKMDRERRGPGASDFSGGERGARSGSAPLSSGSSPKVPGHVSREPQYAQPRQVRPPSVPSSVPSSKPLPHRPFSRTENDLHLDDMEGSVVGTEIVEEEIDMNGERAASISFIPRSVAGGTSEHGGIARQGDYISEVPPSPRSHNSGIAPPIQVSPSARARSHRTAGTRTPNSQRSNVYSQRSGKQRSVEQPPPPEYQHSTPEPWRGAKQDDWKQDEKEKERMLFGDEEKETLPQEEDDSMQADAELLAAFNRVVNLNSAGRGDILDQRAEPHGRISPEVPEYPHRAYQAPADTIARAVVGEPDDLEYPGLTRSGSPPTSSAQQYRQNQARSRPSRASRSGTGTATAMSRGPSADTAALPLTEHELDEPVDPVRSSSLFPSVRCD